MCLITDSNYHLAGASDEEQSRMGKLEDETKKEKQQVVDAMKPKVGSDAQTEQITVLLGQVEQLVQVLNSHVKLTGEYRCHFRNMHAQLVDL